MFPSLVSCFPRSQIDISCVLSWGQDTVLAQLVWLPQDTKSEKGKLQSYSHRCQHVQSSHMHSADHPNFCATGVTLQCARGAFQATTWVICMHKWSKIAFSKALILQFNLLSKSLYCYKVVLRATWPKTINWNTDFVYSHLPASYCLYTWNFNNCLEHVHTRQYNLL